MHIRHCFPSGKLKTLYYQVIFCKNVIYNGILFVFPSKKFCTKLLASFSNPHHTLSPVSLEKDLNGHVVVQSLSRVWLFATPWTAARQASLSFTISQSLLKLMPIESVMPSNCLALCHPLLLLPSIFPSIRVIFQWVISLHLVAKGLELQLQHQSFQWIFRAIFL